MPTLNDDAARAAARCLAAAYDGTMSFPEILATLGAAGIERYTVDYACGATTYFAADGARVTVDHPHDGAAIAARFDGAAVERAVRHAQSGAADYTYEGFCARVMAAGCAGYHVSLLGRRVVYFGRTAETHVEFMPGAR